jgi:outer membrane protein OmpA-like peptidoglycan-associated protein
MNKRNNRILETLLILGLPLAIGAGCAADGDQLSMSKVDQKPEQELNDPSDAAERHVLRLQLDQLSFVETPAAEIEQASDTPAVNDVSVLESGTDSIAMQETDIGPIETEIQMITAEAPIMEEKSSLVTQEEVMPEKQMFFFESASHQVAEVDYEALRSHADFLLKNPSLRVTVIGHADSRGSKEYNATLSEKRAKAVAELLTTFGVSEGQLMTSSYGETLPLQDAAKDDENRRVELKYDDVILLSASE